MSFPNFIQIGPIKVRVIQFSAKFCRQNPDVFGSYDPAIAVIEISDRLSPDRRLVTFLHEIGHAIWNVYEIGKVSDQEAIVSLMAVAWANVYQDNPYLLSWISSVRSP